MSRPINIAAVVLAGGRSSRFGGRHKALSEPKGCGLLSRAASLFRSLGLGQILAIVGYRQKEVGAESNRLGLKTVFNPLYAQGMFSSVQAGIMALDEEKKIPPLGVMILPVDAAMIHPQSVLTMVSYWAELPPEKARRSLVIPTHGGRTGHPPLIGWELVEKIRSWTGPQGLRGALASLMPPTVAQGFSDGFGSNPDGQTGSYPVCFLELPDPLVPVDIDTPDDLDHALELMEDRQLISRPSMVDSWNLLSLNNLEHKKRRHCLMVAQVALRLAFAWKESGGAADLELNFLGGLLHDMAYGEKNHALVGAERAGALGWPELAEVIGGHTDLPPELVAGVKKNKLLSQVDQATMGVYLADKYSLTDRTTSLLTRFTASRRIFTKNREALSSVDRREKTALVVNELFRKQIGRDPSAFIEEPCEHHLEYKLSSLIAELEGWRE